MKSFVAPLVKPSSPNVSSPRVSIKIAPYDIKMQEDVLACKRVAEIVRHYKAEVSIELSPKKQKIVADCFAASSAVVVRQPQYEKLSPVVGRLLSELDEQKKNKLADLKYQIIEEKRWTECANEVGKLCWRLLGVAKPNGVSFALQELTRNDRADLLKAWSKSNDIQFQLLYLYYLPVAEVKRVSYGWESLHKNWITMLKECLAKPSENFPKYILPALSVKLAFFEHTLNRCLPMLRDKKNPLWHVHLEGVKTTVESFELFCIPSVNFAYADLNSHESADNKVTSFRGADVSYGNFYETQFLAVDFTSAMTKDCFFIGAYLRLYPKDKYGQRVKGISDQEIREFFEAQTQGEVYKPLREYFQNYTSCCLFSTEAPRSEYLFAMYALSEHRYKGENADVDVEGGFGLSVQFLSICRSVIEAKYLLRQENQNEIDGKVVRSLVHR